MESAYPAVDDDYLLPAVDKVAQQLAQRAVLGLLHKELRGDLHRIPPGRRVAASLPRAAASKQLSGAIWCVYRGAAAGPDRRALWAGMMVFKPFLAGSLAPQA
jgi:hypothetical protein